MDLRLLARVLRRQWLVVVALLAVTVAAGATLASRIEPEYEARGAVVLLNASTTVGADGEVVRLNPYSRMGGSEAFAAIALVNVASSQPFAEQLVAMGVESEYLVATNPRGGGAILDLQVTAASAADALVDLGTLSIIVRRELADRQERTGAPQETWITSDVLTWPTEATPLYGSRVRVLGVAAVLGISASISIAFLVDILRARAGARRRAAAASSGRGEIAADLDEVPLSADRPVSARRLRVLRRRAFGET